MNTSHPIDDDDDNDDDDDDDGGGGGDDDDDNTHKSSYDLRTAIVSPRHFQKYLCPLLPPVSTVAVVKTCLPSRASPCDPSWVYSVGVLT